MILLPSFIADLQDQSDANFARRVFRKLFDRDGGFRDDGDDHRYHGIPGAWIRYISQGGAAFRVIYIRDGAKIYAYRAGPHSVEDNLSCPSRFSSGVQTADEAPGDVAARIDGQSHEQPIHGGRGELLSSLRTPSLQQQILARALYPHREVALVSPFLSMDLLLRTAKIGRMLDRQIEDGARVVLITRPPEPNMMDAFADLEVRGFELHFHPRLHAKLYSFIGDPGRAKPYTTTPADFIVLGSANLTISGFAGTREVGNEELSYCLPKTERDEVESFLAHLAIGANDLTGVRIEMNRQRKRR